MQSFSNRRTTSVIQDSPIIRDRLSFLKAQLLSIITDAFPENERGRALGINQISIVVGSVMGLVFGGFLTTYLGWRSIFWINIPIGVFAIIWSHTKKLA